MSKEDQIEWTKDKLTPELKQMISKASDESGISEDSYYVAIEDDYFSLTRTNQMIGDVVIEVIREMKEW